MKTQHCGSGARGGRKIKVPDLGNLKKEWKVDSKTATAITEWIEKGVAPGGFALDPKPVLEAIEKACQDAYEARDFSALPTQASLQQILGRGSAKIKQILTILEAEGKIKHIGRNNHARWVSTRFLPEATK